MLIALALAAALAGAPASEATPPDSSASDPVRAKVDPRLTPGFDACLEKPEGQSTAGMIECIGQELKIQDRRLNAQYRKTLADLNPRQRARLAAAEKSWIAWRDAECASFQDEDWGTLSRITANHCVLDMTVQRLIALEGYPPE